MCTRHCNFDAIQYPVPRPSYFMPLVYGKWMDEDDGNLQMLFLLSIRLDVIMREVRGSSSADTFVRFFASLTSSDTFYVSVIVSLS